MTVVNLARQRNANVQQQTLSVDRGEHGRTPDSAAFGELLGDGTAGECRGKYDADVADQHAMQLVVSGTSANGSFHKIDSHCGVGKSRCSNAFRQMRAYLMHRLD